MTEHCDHDGCITCGDEAVAMRVLRVDEERALALCADDDGRRETVEIALVAPIAPGRRAARARRHRHRADRRRAVRFVDEFRDPALGRTLTREIAELVEPDRHYKIMEVCGGHTHAIYKYGIDDMLPANVEMVHGPGCPVCVIPMGRVDDGIALAREDGVILACFGDMMRVPGSEGSFLDAKAQGADVRMVYSPLDALRIARDQPGPHGRVLRDRLRDHGAVDGPDAQAAPRPRASRTSCACAAT